MGKGTIKFFNSTKWFGFIVEDQQGAEIAKEYFVHISHCNGYTPKDGDRVSFEVTQWEKGLMATNVNKLVDEVVE